MQYSKIGCNYSRSFLYESIFVGDHPENDVKAAQNVGMKGIWKKGFQWNNVKAAFIVDDLVELPLMPTNY